MYGQDIYTNSKNERRNMPRWDVSKPVYCHLETNGDVYEGLSENLSYYGICFNVNKDMALRQDVYMAIRLSEEDVVYLHGKVAWKEKAGTKVASRVGLELSAVDDVARDLIYKYSFRLHRKEFIDNFFKGWDGGE